MAYSDLSERQLGVAPALIAVGISTLSKLFGSKSGKTTHAQRFGQAVQAGDTATAKLLVDQAYSHAFVEQIPDRGDWQTVWAQMLTMADGDVLKYMQAKMGPTAGPASPSTGGAVGGQALSLTGGGFGAISPVVLLAVAGGAFLFLRRKRG